MEKLINAKRMSLNFNLRYDSNRSINNKCELIERLVNKVMAWHTDFLRYRIEAVR